MATINFSPIISEARGKVGDYVFSRNTYGAYVRGYVVPTDPNTSRQQLFRGLFATVAATWKTLTQAQRTSWNERAIDWNRRNIFGNEVKYSGYTLYCKLNVRMNLFSQTLLVTPPEFIAPTLVIPQSLTVDVGTSDMTLTWAPAATSSNRIQIQTASPVSAGVNYVSSEYRNTSQLASGTSTNLWSSYNMRHGGTPSVGDKVFARLWSFNTATGIYSPRRAISAIAT